MDDKRSMIRIAHPELFSGELKKSPPLWGPPLLMEKVDFINSGTGSLDDPFMSFYSQIWQLTSKKIFKVFDFGCHGNQNSAWIYSIWAILIEDHPRKFLWSFIKIGQIVSDEMSFKAIVDNVRLMPDMSLLCLGELKRRITGILRGITKGVNFVGHTLNLFLYLYVECILFISFNWLSLHKLELYQQVLDSILMARPWQTLHILSNSMTMQIPYKGILILFLLLLKFLGLIPLCMFLVWWLRFSLIYAVQSI